MDKTIVEELRQELARHADERYRASIQRFFKEPVDLYGVKTPDVRRISQQYFARVKDLPKREVFEICELLHGGLGHDPKRRTFGRRGPCPTVRSCPAPKSEEHGIAFSWAGKLASQFEPRDFHVFEGWLKKYVTNWAACDVLCGGPIGEFLLRFPEFLPKVQAWTGSKNRWVRRAAAVALIPAVHKEQHIREAFAIADILLRDEDDMVQKGYGWLLKEVSNKRPREVFDFVMKRKGVMPRTALRYAIEKMSPAWKKRAMAK